LNCVSKKVVMARSNSCFVSVKLSIKRRDRRNGQFTEIVEEKSVF